ncbi:hypothetical protein EV126DRAFT_17297 [Verticillium dahliae]|nr:hypothetical protein EV126DRAFT_17297 [Verticillium dahliae]
MPGSLAIHAIVFRCTLRSCNAMESRGVVAGVWVRGVRIVFFSFSMNDTPAPMPRRKVVFPGLALVCSDDMGAFFPPFSV